MTDTDTALPGVETWVRVRTDNSDDLAHAESLMDQADQVYGRDLLNKLDPVVVVLYSHGTVEVYTEHEWEYTKKILTRQAEAEPENGQVPLFELTGEQQRTDLAKWAEMLLPGTDLVDLQRRVHTGDLVMKRPGTDYLEVFRRVEGLDFDRTQNRLRCVELAMGDLDKAKKIDDWVHGGEL